jgi:hypothetical protein
MSPESVLDWSSIQFCPMKTNIRLVFAWAFALIAFCSVSLAQKGGTPVSSHNPSFQISISENSPKRTPLAWGEKNATFVTYDMKHDSKVPETVKYIWFGKAATVESVSIEIGDTLVPATIRSSENYYRVAVPVFRTILPGETWTFNVRGTVVAKDPMENYAGASIDFSGIEVDAENYGWSTQGDSFYHPIFDRSQFRSGITNTSGLQRLENVSAYGFVIGGRDKFSRSKVLVRIAGPSLENMRIADVLRDPTLKIYNDRQQVVGTADDWPIQLESEFSRLGAFPFTRGSFDSALEVELAPGSYTVEVKNHSSVAARGAYLIEVYQQ